MRKLSDEKKKLHLAQLIAWSFIGSFISYVLSMFFIPDVSTDPPVISPVLMWLSQIQTALYILACTSAGIKLSEERNTIPSIGFTMMSIAQGVMYVIFTFSINSHAKLEEAYKMFSASMYLIVPAMILITFYGSFPRWLNIAGIISLIPYILENVFFAFTGKLTTTIMVIDTIGNIGFNLVGLCWGVLILKNAKMENASG